MSKQTRGLSPLYSFLPAEIFANWPALNYAILDNIVPDFPLVNKSFNLSYAGNDL
jgi:Ni,Fe-hydrogenase III large subunit